MNAYELADDLWDKDTQASQQSLQDWAEQSANMLRQQADRIAELEKDLHMLQRHYDQLNHDTPQTKPLSDEKINLPVKTYTGGKPHYVQPRYAELTDEEIERLREYHGINDWLYETSIIDFARAIEAKVRGEK